MKNEIDRLVSGIGELVVGKERKVRLSIACLVAKGHLLIEDLPGVGKTTLSHAIAHLLGLDFHRIQFTSDLLPADILGNSIFDRNKGGFVFHPGPLFSQVVLIDEVNRATPKTQSALLEAMEEGRVSIDGKTHRLPAPFAVIATQNPQEQIGTFPLPESQLDRFMMRIEIGVPDRASERLLLQGRDRRDLLASMDPVATPGDLARWQQQASEIHASNPLLDYLQDLIGESRRVHRSGLSPRAGLAVLRSAKAWALMEGRGMVLPEDVQAVSVPVMAHRLPSDPARHEESGASLAARLIQSTPVP